MSTPLLRLNQQSVTLRRFLGKTPQGIVADNKSLELVLARTIGNDIAYMRNLYQDIEPLGIPIAIGIGTLAGTFINMEWLYSSLGNTAIWLLLVAPPVSMLATHSICSYKKIYLTDLFDSTSHLDIILDRYGIQPISYTAKYS